MYAEKPLRVKVGSSSSPRMLSLLQIAMSGSKVVDHRIHNNYSFAVNSQVFTWIPIRKLGACENNTAHNCIHVSGYPSKTFLWDVGLLGRVCDRDETEFLLFGFFFPCFFEALNRV